MRSSKTLAGAFSLLTVVLVACSSPTVPTDSSNQSDTGSDTKDDTDSTKPSPSSKNTPAKNSTGTSVGTTPASVQGTGPCAGKGSSDACYTCCETLTDEIKKYEAAETAIEKEYQTCACAPTRCADSCKTSYCAAGSDPDDDNVDDDACETCLESSKTDDCDAIVDPKYDANDATPGGVAEEACYADAKCEEMEDAEDAASGDTGDDDDGDDDDDDDAATP